MVDLLELSCFDSEITLGQQETGINLNILGNVLLQDLMHY